MKIHHVTMPARDPRRVAGVLAEILGARVIPLPHPHGTLLVYAGDTDGTAIEVWPAALRGSVGAHEPELREELPLPPAWPHHAYLTGDVVDPDAVVAAFTREGWRAEKVYNGAPGRGFGLVRGWLENQTPIEIGGRANRDEYEAFFRAALARSA